MMSRFSFEGGLHAQNKTLRVRENFLSSIGRKQSFCVANVGPEFLFCEWFSLVPPPQKMFCH